MNTEETRSTVKLRAHHGMCLAYFEGKGYSDGFTAHMGQIKRQLEADSGQIVELVTEADVICSACPNNVDGVCSSAGKVERYDAGVLQVLQVLQEAQSSPQDPCPASPEKNHSAKDPGDPGSAENSSQCSGVFRMSYADFSKRVREHILKAGKRPGICGDCQWNEICKEKDRHV